MVKDKRKLKPTALRKAKILQSASLGLTLLHSEQQKLHRVLAILKAIGLIKRKLLDYVEWTMSTEIFHWLHE